MRRLDLPRDRWRLSGLHQYLLVALAIEAVLAICVLVKGKAFAFVDIGADTFACFVPLQIAFARQFRELHDLTWSFNLGLGGYIGSLFDPFWILTAPFPDSWQLSLRLPLYLIKVLLAGGFFYGYLRLVGFRTKLAVFGGLAYAFSSYGMINAQWDLLHGVELVQFSAFLFLLEKYLCQGRRWAAVCAGLVIGLGHPFGLYMFALLSFTYLVMRLFSAVGRKERIAYFMAIGRFGGWFLVGLMLTSPLLLPNLYYFLESPRVSGDYSQLSSLIHTIFSINDRGTISAEIAGLLDKNILGIGNDYGGWNNYLEGPGFYVGLLPLLCIPQLLGPSATRRERWLCIVGIVGIALYFVFPALRYAVYGFGHVVFRFSTLWISALILVLGLAGLRRAILSGPWRPGIAIGVTAVLAIVAGCVFLLTKVVNLHHAALVVGFVAIYAVFLGCREILANQSGPALRILIAMLACELLLVGLPSTLDRDKVGSDGVSTEGMFVGTYHDGTQQALEAIRQVEPDGNFYRVEKTYQSLFLDDALIQGYHGIKSYFFHASSITRFIDRMELPRTIKSANTIASPGMDRRGALDLLGVKYFLSRDRALDAMPQLTYLTATNGIHIYRNEAAHELGHFYDKVISEATADALPPVQRDALLLQSAIVDDPDSMRTEIARLRGEAAAPVSDAPDETRFTMQNDTAIDAALHVSTATLLLLSIPYDIGWSASLDDTPVELFRADYGLTAALVPAGNHSLALRYTPPYRRLGLWLCLLSVLVIATGFMANRYAERKQRRARTA